MSEGTRVIRPVDMQMVKEYLQENLEISINYNSFDEYWKVEILLENEPISSDSFYTR